MLIVVQHGMCQALHLFTCSCELYRARIMIYVELSECLVAVPLHLALSAARPSDATSGSHDSVMRVLASVCMLLLLLMTTDAQALCFGDAASVKWPKSCQVLAKPSLVTCRGTRHTFSSASW